MAVVIELLFVLLHFGGEVLPVAACGELGVPAVVPIVESVAAGLPVGGISEEPAVGGRHGLLGMDEDGAVFGRGFQAALTDEDLGLALEPDIEPVEALFEDVERRIGGMDLDALVEGELGHPEISAAFREVDLDTLLPFRGENGEFDLGVIAEAEVIPPAEMDLGLAAFGPELVPLDQGKVDLALFVAQVRCPLDEHRAADIGQAGKTVGVESLVLGHEAEGDQNDEADRQERSLCHHLVHRLSPSASYLKQLSCHAFPQGDDREGVLN
jgi:hypothetical protein